MIIENPALEVQKQKKRSSSESTLAIYSIEIYVGNLVQASHYFRSALGLEALEHSNELSRCQDTTSVVLGQHDIRVILTAARERSEVSDHVQRHGDSVKDIGLLVKDVDDVFENAVRHGASPILEPCAHRQNGELVKKAIVGTPGAVTHTLVQPPATDRSDTTTVPGQTIGRDRSRLRSVDHIALAVGRGDLERWAEYYRSAFQFEVTFSENTATELTGMRSVVVENDSRTVKFPLVEPLPGKRPSQIEEFVRQHNGPGVQHVAMLCDDIGEVVQKLRANGVEFIRIPDSYYEMLSTRLKEIDSEIAFLKETRVLIDRDEWGDLLQVFTKPVTGRQTLFFELIQRRGARGFGAGNVRALFEAVEREQAARSGW